MSLENEVCAEFSTIFVSSFSPIGLLIFLILMKYSSYIFANPYATFTLIGLNILTRMYISSFKPLRKQLSLRASNNPLKWLDKASNCALCPATVLVYFRLVNVSMGSSYVIKPKQRSINLMNVFQSLHCPPSTVSWYHTRASPSMW